MKKNIIFEKRKKAKNLREKNWSIRKIANYLAASKDSVNKWINLEKEELERDNRGWRKGELRRHTKEEVERIKSLRVELEKEESYFIGAKVIRQNYEERYDSSVPLWFIKQVLRDHNMTKNSKPDKSKKRSRYMQYPEYTLRKTGKSMISIDFIGPKYLKGSNNRINFLSCKYIRPNKEGIIKRVQGQTSQEAIRVLKEIWKKHPIPEVVKMDNDSAFGANLSHKRCIGKLGIMLLNLGVTPLYIAAKSPWNNGHVEGFNSIFAKKFWNKLQFSDEDELQVKIKSFNMEYQKYSRLINNDIPFENPKYLTGKEKDKQLFNYSIDKLKSHKIIFLRVVRRKGEKGGKERGFIRILENEIYIPKKYINLFTWCELDIKAKKLKIYVEEEDGKLSEVKTVKYQLKNIEYNTKN